MYYCNNTIIIIYYMIRLHYSNVFLKIKYKFFLDKLLGWYYT